MNRKLFESPCPLWASPKTVRNSLPEVLIFVTQTGSAGQVRKKQEKADSLGCQPFLYIIR